PALFCNQLLYSGIFIFCFCLKYPTKRGFWIGFQDGQIKSMIIFHQQGLIVSNQFCTQGNDENSTENNEAAKAQLMLLKTLPACLHQGRHYCDPRRELK